MPCHNTSFKFRLTFRLPITDTHLLHMSISELNAEFQPIVDGFFNATIMNAFGCGKHNFYFRLCIQIQHNAQGSIPWSLPRPYVSIMMYHRQLKKNVLINTLVGKLHRKGNKGFYSCSLILLWVSTITNFSFARAKIRAGFVGHNGSPVEIFEGFQLTSALTIVNTIAGISCILIADAIIVSTIKPGQATTKL